MFYSHLDVAHAVHAARLNEAAQARTARSLAAHPSINRRNLNVRRAVGGVAVLLIALFGSGSVASASGPDNRVDVEPREWAAIDAGSLDSVDRDGTEVPTLDPVLWATIDAGSLTPVPRSPAGAARAPAIDPVLWAAVDAGSLKTTQRFIEMNDIPWAAIDAGSLGEEVSDTGPARIR